jgi:hypothetical protein
MDDPTIILIKDYQKEIEEVMNSHYLPCNKSMDLDIRAIVIWAKIPEKITIEESLELEFADKEYLTPLPVKF